ncbi:Bombesin receptor-activated protein C6orf89-like protein [Frankliniella fusca]|uniref:Bombesin receptor-activated protein C6orf89-like protein n=1 Tax=Frankliniella fusca TaxID=407009 RepID=A0AAE1GWS3_9NEOP|nr:Bombesin receptor-activated protein C6orf89-like protein [Frankliniella fusca]
MVSFKSHLNTLFLSCQEEKYGINSQGRVISRSTVQLYNILSPVYNTHSEPIFSGMHVMQSLLHPIDLLLAVKKRSME